jgi:D-xylose 1-dehydrogenase (NADP+, D-xylono-1,5-lactone-forming)
VLGAADIARGAVLPAIAASRNGAVVAMASRTPDRARKMLEPHAGARVCASYEELIEQDDVDAVYIPLVNSLHAEWSTRALQAGKHVLCEKPLAMTAREAETMADAARNADRRLMEAFMYRFNPELQSFVAGVRDPLHVDASFGFTLADAANYRLQASLGGGALLDVGCYAVSVSRWILGEPVRVRSVARMEGGVDMTTAALLECSEGRSASIFASFESPEEQELRVIGNHQAYWRHRPFGSPDDRYNAYQLMVESFGDSILHDTRTAIPLEESIANMRVLDDVREASGASGRPSAR